MFYQIVNDEIRGADAANVPLKLPHLNIHERIPIYFPSGQSFSWRITNSLIRSSLRLLWDMLFFFWPCRNETRFSTPTDKNGWRREAPYNNHIFLLSSVQTHVQIQWMCNNRVKIHLVKFAKIYKHFYFLSWKCKCFHIYIYINIRRDDL